jgi:transposase-like protein
MPVAPGDYLVGASGKKSPLLICKLCNEFIPMQSNLAIAEELIRISAYLEPERAVCPKKDCAAFGKATLEDGKPACVRFGANSAGSPRYRCQACRKTFSFGGRSTLGQHMTHVNRDIFIHLMNAMPIRRVIKVLGISPSVLYQRIDFLYDQCQKFAGARECTLVDRTDLGTRYLTVDRQKLMVNWSSKRDRRNTLLLLMATADLSTGYVYAANLNYDGALDEAAIEADSVKYGDEHLAWPFRRYARVWLSSDYDAAAVRRTKRAGALAASESEQLQALIEQTYEAALRRDDIEAGEDPTLATRTPPRGMQLHEQVVMNAHIQLVTRLLCRADNLQIFADQESGIRAAIMAACHDRIKARTADAYYVSLLKETTIDRKRRKMAEIKAHFEEYRTLNPGLTDDEIKIQMMCDALTSAVPVGHFKDAWVSHPLPDMREPEKKVCWLTEIGARPEDPEYLELIALRHLCATLAPVDRFFMQIRRGITLAERGIPSASTERLWFGKNAYNPNVLVKLVAIFRTYFNYCEVGADHKTPAMRLGLAKGLVRPEDIIYWTPPEPARLRRRATKTKPLATEAGGARIKPISTVSRNG